MGEPGYFSLKVQHSLAVFILDSSGQQQLLLVGHLGPSCDLASVLIKLFLSSVLPSFLLILFLLLLLQSYKTFSTKLNRSGRNSHPTLIPDLREIASSLTIHYDVRCSLDALYQVEEVPF